MRKDKMGMMSKPRHNQALILKLGHYNIRTPYLGRAQLNNQGKFSMCGVLGWRGTINILGIIL
jgi:hypothetical protein